MGTPPGVGSHRGFLGKRGAKTKRLLATVAFNLEALSLAKENRQTSRVLKDPSSNRIERDRKALVYEQR
jgi:hypothetical protein